MELLPETLRIDLPALYSQEGAENPQVYLKYFHTDSNWTWFVTEGEPREEDFLFFGYVVGFEEEWGYFVLSELESHFSIEQDLSFKPGPFQTVLASVST